MEYTEMSYVNRKIQNMLCFNSAINCDVLQRNGFYSNCHERTLITYCAFHLTDCFSLITAEYIMTVVNLVYTLYTNLRRQVMIKKEKKQILLSCPYSDCVALSKAARYVYK